MSNILSRTIQGRKYAEIDRIEDAIKKIENTPLSKEYDAALIKYKNANNQLQFQYNSMCQDERDAYSVQVDEAIRVLNHEIELREMTEKHRQQLLQEKHDCILETRRFQRQKNIMGSHKQETLEKIANLRKQADEHEQSASNLSIEFSEIVSIIDEKINVLRKQLNGASASEKVMINVQLGRLDAAKINNAKVYSLKSDEIAESMELAAMKRRSADEQEKGLAEEMEYIDNELLRLYGRVD